MQAYRFETIVPQSGELQLKQIPFRPGELVEVIVLSLNRVKSTVNLFPLKSTVLKYEEPTEPVADTDWAVLQ